MKLSKEQAEEFYAEHKARPFFESLVTFMTSGPVVALVLRKENAIKAWRSALGPTNASAAREIGLIFPELSPQLTYAMIKPDVTARGAEEVARMLARVREIG